MTNQLKFSFDIIDENENEPLPFRYQITSYGADYPVDSLIKRIKDKVIFVPPFQRKFVWDIFEASKFVESLLLGLPVPSIFLSKEKKTNRLLIVDGQQRLMSLYSFYNGVFKESEFKLSGVVDDLEGKTYRELSPSDKNRLDDSILHSIIVRQDEPDDNDSSIYQLFERINSGGRELSPQEIRACIYYGEYNEFLNELTNDINWRQIFGRKKNERLKEQELILRFFSLLKDDKFYEKPLKDFLNKRMSENRNFEIHPRKELEDIFRRTVEFIQAALGKSAFKIQRGIHTGLYDSVMVATAIRLNKGGIKDKQAFRDIYNELLEDNFFMALIDSGTSDENNVRDRLKHAISKIDSV